MKNIHKRASLTIQKTTNLREEGEDEHITLPIEAFKEEKEAALSLQADFHNEPTRSTLFRNAASLAMNCRKYAEAEKLAAQGLAGNPPEEVMDELRELYQQINARLYKEIRLPVHR